MSFSFHMWAVVVGSLLCPERFFSRCSSFPLIRQKISKSLFIYLFIYLQLTKFTKMNVWVYYLYWSNKYPVGPDDPICRVATMKRNQTKIDEEEFPIVSDEISAEY